MNITIIGAGVYALAMMRALMLNNENKIKIWCESNEAKERFLNTRNGILELGNLDIHEDVEITTSYEEALRDADVVFIMCALKFVASVSKNIAPFVTDKMHFVIGSKGIEHDSCFFGHEIFFKYINTERVAVISGPSFAIDVANLEPIGLSCATSSKDTIDAIYKIYSGTNIKIVLTNDLIGVSLCGAIKNVYAVASGILEGLGLSESTRSLFITEALHDIKNLIISLGGNENTILSFSGVGDLLLTATSTKSRNYTYGVLLGKNKLDDAILYLEDTTVEGYYTLKSIHTLLLRKNLSVPIIDLIYDIVIKNDNPKKLVDFLLNKK